MTSENSSTSQSLARKNALPWEDYFMASAVLTAMRSKDPSTQVGAVIVNRQNRIVSLGYNGMPKGCPDDQMPWGKDNKKSLEDKNWYVCHAEMNAIVGKSASDLEGCTVYVTLFPCNECAKIIIQSGIQRVVYLSDKNKGTLGNEASKRMLRMARIKFDPFSRDGMDMDTKELDGIPIILAFN